MDRIGTVIGYTVVVIFSCNTQVLSIDNDPSVHLYLQEGSQVKIGRGNDPNDIPIIECTNSSEKLAPNCKINIRSKKDDCQLSLSPDDGTASIKVDFLYQFRENKVVVVWQQPRGTEKFNKTITIVAMDNCTDTATLTFSKIDLQVLVLYKDGFDAVVAAKPKTLHEEGERTRISYDLNGKEIEKSPVSKGSTQYGREDKQVKEVLTLRDGEFEEQEIISTESGEYSSICGRQSRHESGRFVCVQMNANGHVYRQEFRLPDNTRVVGVRNFKDGGMMLFGLEGDSKLTVVEMRLGRRPRVRSVKLKWTVNENESVVVDFCEYGNDLHFTLIGETDEFDHSVVMQFFRFFDKRAMNHRKKILNS